MSTPRRHGEGGGSISNSGLSTPQQTSGHKRQAASQARTIVAKSPHVEDLFLQSFLSPSFDPADYLNASLPPLQAHASAVTPSANGAVPLSELSSQAQTLLTQVNAHTTRLTGTLTQLTDDILRSGSRLAYEVELLRGETLSLSETLKDGLKDDIAKFVPQGEAGEVRAEKDGIKDDIANGEEKNEKQEKEEGDNEKPSQATAATVDDPLHISQLRTLTLVRSRLDTVIKTFGDAMEFVFPPSELSVSSSFLSVSAPDAGGQQHSTEDKGQQVLRQLRDEISTLLREGDPFDGIEKAARRVENLKDLSKVWKGTAEDQGRCKFIDTLARMVEERHRELLKELEPQNSSRRDLVKDAESSSSSPRRSTDGGGDGGITLSGYSIMSQLQKLRGGL